MINFKKIFTLLIAASSIYASNFSEYSDEIMIGGEPRRVSITATEISFPNGEVKTFQEILAIYNGFCQANQYCALQREPGLPVNIMHQIVKMPVELEVYSSDDYKWQTGTDGKLHKFNKKTGEWLDPSEEAALFQVGAFTRELKAILEKHKKSAY